MYDRIVFLRKDAKGRLFARISDNDNSSGKIFFPDRKWKDAKEGSARVTITKEFDKYGFILGEQPEDTPPTLDQIIKYTMCWWDIHIPMYLKDGRVFVVLRAVMGTQIMELLRDGVTEEVYAVDFDDPKFLSGVEETSPFMELGMQRWGISKEEILEIACGLRITEGYGMFIGSGFVYNHTIIEISADELKPHKELDSLVRSGFLKQIIVVGDKGKRGYIPFAGFYTEIVKYDYEDAKPILDKLIMVNSKFDEAIRE